MQENEIDGFTDGEEPMIFHYSRKHRLEHAPQNVRDFYDGKMNVQRGLLKSLVATRANRCLLFSIVVCMAALFFVSKFGRDSFKDTIDGTQAEIAAFSFENTVYVSTSLKAVKSPSASDDVSAKITALNEEKKEIACESLSDFYDGKELFLRTTFEDNDIMYVEAEIEIFGKISKISTKVRKN